MAMQVGQRGTATTYVFQPSVEKGLECRIRGEYSEMPGLRLTADQATRLWSLDHETCVHLLDALIDEGFLRLDEFGRYARNHSGY